MAYVSGRLFAGQKTGITTTASQLHASQVCREVLIQSDSSNAGNILVGNVDGQHIILTPGQSITLPIFSLSLIYVKTSTGTGSVNWIARD